MTMNDEIFFFVGGCSRLVCAVGGGFVLDLQVAEKRQAREHGRWATLDS